MSSPDAPVPQRPEGPNVGPIPGLDPDLRELSTFEGMQAEIARGEQALGEALKMGDSPRAEAAYRAAHDEDLPEDVREKVEERAKIEERRRVNKVLAEHVPGNKELTIARGRHNTWFGQERSKWATELGRPLTDEESEALGALARRRWMAQNAHLNAPYN